MRMLLRGADCCCCLALSWSFCSKSLSTKMFISSLLSKGDGVPSVLGPGLGEVDCILGSGGAVVEAGCAVDAVEVRSMVGCSCSKMFSGVSCVVNSGSGLLWVVSILVLGTAPSGWVV